MARSRYRASLALWAAFLDCVHSRDLTSPHMFVWVGKYTSFFQEPNVRCRGGHQCGQLYAAGRNDYNQLGIGLAGVSPTCPTPVLLPDYIRHIGVQHVAAGAFHVLFLMGDRTLFVAGRNHHGQLGLGSAEAPRTGTVQIMPDLVVDDIAAGYAHSIFVSEDRVYTMGWNAQGQLGTGDTLDRWVPTLIWEREDAPQPVVGVAAGHDFSFFWTQYSPEREAEVFAVGNNLGGQLGIPGRVSLLTPIEVQWPGRRGNYQAFPGDSHVLFDSHSFHESGYEVWAAGSNFAGQLGDGLGIGFQDTPKMVDFLNTSEFDLFQYPAAAGGDSSCVSDIINGSRVRCAGSNYFGQIGMEDQPTSSVFQSVLHFPSLPRVHISVAVGAYHSLAMTYSGTEYTLLATGTNGYGQLGDCTREPRKVFRPDQPTTSVGASSSTGVDTAMTTSAPVDNVTTTEANFTTPSRVPTGVVGGDLSPWFVFAVIMSIMIVTWALGGGISQSGRILNSTTNTRVDQSVGMVSLSVAENSLSSVHT